MGKLQNAQNGLFQDMGWYLWHDLQIMVMICLPLLAWVSWFLWL